MTALKGQLWHVILLIALLTGLFLFDLNDPSVSLGSLFGVSSQVWFILAVSSPILHQIYVVVVWRLELHYNTLSKMFGDKGFFFFKIGFTILILSRPVLITLLAFSNSNTIVIDPVIRYLVSGILAFLVCYLFYSVIRYFGMDRAFGMDHFYPEEAKKLPMVKQGIFRYSSNAMYVFGFLVLWIPGVLLQSRSALLVAMFSQIYIWIHYYFTEKPDMKLIYGSLKK